jgi:two-component system cell cycle response regulator DivK
MSAVFISYATEDKELARRVAHAIEARGWSVFWDRNIPVGRTWDEVVEAEVEKASCVVVLWSRSSVSSGWVRAEAEEGATRGVLVPVLLEEIKVPIRFRSIQAAHLHTPPSAPEALDYTNLFEAIERFAGAPAANRSSVNQAADRSLGPAPEPFTLSLEPAEADAASTKRGKPAAPEAAQRATGAQTRHEAMPARGGVAMAKILIVEDDEMNRDMLSRRLLKRGYEVTIAVDGVEGVRLATEQSPDLVLMDMSLPEMDGWEAIRQLRAAQTTSAIPIIALTAHAMADDRRKAIEAGCNDFDTKPVELTRLLGKIEALLAKKPTLGP